MVTTCNDLSKYPRVTFQLKSVAETQHTLDPRGLLEQYPNGSPNGLWSLPGYQALP